MAKTQMDLSDIVMGQEYRQDFVVERQSFGKVVKGRFTEETELINMRGVVTATDEKDILMIPEGDRSNESKTFYTIQKLYATRVGLGQNVGTSDIIRYRDSEWKVTATTDLGDYGYYKAVAINIRADE